MEKGGNGHGDRRVIDAIEQTPKCPNCGVPCDNWCNFCGECGNKNPSFSHEQFQKELGTTLEDIQEQEGCNTGHGPAMEDPDRIARFCIYCGKAY